MPINESEILLCYNKGCGQQFDPNKNTEESCLHHPGAPFFHDAYKGWTCCKKKCTDFTEFLNIKGCTQSCHSNVKPEEPQKVVEKSNPEEVIEYKAPTQPQPKPIERPPFNTPLATLTPTVSNALRQQAAGLVESSAKEAICDGSEEVPLGTVCKNHSCNMTFLGPESHMTTCIHHPGFPIFHEGLKYWTCCNKRTSDFNVFLKQAGCHIGEHVWLKIKTSNDVKCRLDWHQTGQFIVISVYAKKYDPDSSIIQLSPVRLKITLHFPEQDGNFESDMELIGVVDVNQSSVQMLPTKVEIKLHKAQASNWSKLHFPPAVLEEKPKVKLAKLQPRLIDVDLSTL